MHLGSRLLLGVAVWAIACSSSSNPTADAGPNSPPHDGPVADLAGNPADGPDHLDAPSSLYYLKWSSVAVGDAGDPVHRRELGAWPDGRLYYYDSNAAPADGMMTAAELTTFVQFLNRPGVFDELISTTACGPPYADYNEYVTVGLGSGERRKEITACQQPVYEALRQLVQALVAAHFQWPAGSCPAPNVWRYMSPGCGAAAHPVCGSSAGDGCAAVRCSCNGRVIYGCDFTPEPYAYEGFCRDGGP